MVEYDVRSILRRLGLACAVLAMLVASSPAQTNPDGPVGAVALEPSFVFGGSSGFDQQLSAWSAIDLRKGDDDDRPGDPGGPAHWLPASWVPRDVESRWESYGLSVLVPASRAWTLGFSYAYTNFDEHDKRYGFSNVTTQVNTWSVGMRARYWWNLPE